jgi:ribosome-associated translation inhibitor RaiA
MQVPLQITYRGLERSEALDARIRSKATKLGAFHPRIMSCRVVVEESDRHRHQGRHFVVRLDVRLPGHEIAVNRDADQDVYVALREAFGAAGRRLEELARVDRGDVKSHAAPRGAAPTG